MRLSGGRRGSTGKNSTLRPVMARAGLAPPDIFGERKMAIIKKELGNSRAVIKKAFGTHYSDGFGGIRFDAFCMGWKEAWHKCSQNLQAENEKLKQSVEEAIQLAEICSDWNLDEAEINGKMFPMYAIREHFEQALNGKLGELK